MKIDYRNAYRYPGKGNWFDFWNCRVVIPETKRWFFFMPHVLSKEGEISCDFYYCSNEGEVKTSRLSEELTLGTENASVSWGDNLFSDDKMAIIHQGHEWNFDITRLCSDGGEGDVEKRKFDVGERMVLRNTDFMHRVPTMKGLANGFIKLPNEHIELKNAIVYQAKNHGPDFPKHWMWLHVNIIEQFPNSAFEIGIMPSKSGFHSIFRWSDEKESHVHASFLGDELIFEEKGDIFIFQVKDKEGKLVIEGKAKHGKTKEIKFLTPNNGIFSTPESFNGYVSGSYKGEFFESNYPALGKGIKKITI